MASTESAAAAAAPPPWYAAYPAPRNKQPDAVTREEVLDMMKSGLSISGKDFVLVDLRRADREVRLRAKPWQKRP